MCDKATKLQCYKTFVRPIVEYYSSVWDPIGNQKLRTQIESVQRKAARWIFNKWQYDESPSTMITNLNLTSLQDRRKMSRLSTMFEFHHGLKYMLDQTIIRQRYVDVRFQPIHGALQVYSNLFYPYTIREWKMLPVDIVNSDSLDVFKDKLIGHMK